MQFKFCSECKTRKSINQFHKCIRDGISSWCKECYKEYYILHKEEIKKYKVKHYQIHKEEIREKHKEYQRIHIKEIKQKHHDYWLINKKQLRQKQINYNITNRDKIKQYQHNWYIKHKEKIIKRQIDNEKSKYKTDICFRILKNLRVRIRLALKGNLKSEITMKLLGCSIKFFRNYYESKFTKGMSWTKVMNGEIHCDHIKPCASFDLSKPSEQKKCFNYTNLQPLWAIDNLRKNKKEFICSQ
jgi:ATP-dependent Lon protease